MISADDTGNLVFSVPDDHLYFDLWLDDRWIGMSTGVDEAHARKQLNESYDVALAAKMILTPYKGRGTSQATYKAVTGRECKN